MPACAAANKTFHIHSPLYKASAEAKFAWAMPKQPKMNSSERFAPQTIQRQAAQKQCVLGAAEWLKGFSG